MLTFSTWTSNSLDRLADLRLVRVLVHLERVLAVGDQAVALLRDDRREQHLVRMEAHQAPSLDERQRSLADRDAPRPDDRGDLELGWDRDEHRGRYGTT